jgi:DNA-binding winged helix-turn-helix (wHTH) protein/tetratricopeptide (TPR) repeat protein
MESVAKYGTIYEFDEFRLIPGENLLLRNGEPVSLTPKALRVLAVLVERNGHLVEKSELLDLIWEDSFVEEGSLSKAVWLARQALGDTSKERFIQTVPKRGYRFVFPVSVITNGSGAFRLTDVSGADENGNDVIPKVEDQVMLPTAHLADWEGRPDFEQSLPERPSRSRTWRRAAIYASFGGVLLVAVSVYIALQGSNTAKIGRIRDRGTQNEEAYRLYLQAENLTQRRLPKDMQAALNYVNQAITLDPKFARAWAYKAHLHAYLAQYPGFDENEERRKSMDAVATALEIDPDQPEAYAIRCFNKAHYEYDFAGAEIDCKRALKLDPDSAIGHQRYSSFLRSRGRFDEAIAEAKRAVELQPISFDSQQNYAITLRFARRYEEEETEWKSLLEQNPAHSLIYTRLFTNLANQGKYDKAFEYLIRRLTEVNKADNETIERFRAAYATSGWSGVIRERIKHLDLESQNGPVDVAFLYASLGDKDKAFEYLEQACKERNSRTASLQVEPQLDPLRNDPRFEDLVKRVEGQR